MFRRDFCQNKDRAPSERGMSRGIGTPALQRNLWGWRLLRTAYMRHLEALKWARPVVEVFGRKGDILNVAQCPVQEVQQQRGCSAVDLHTESLGKTTVRHLRICISQFPPERTVRLLPLLKRRDIHCVGDRANLRNRRQDGSKVRLSSGKVADNLSGGGMLRGRLPSYAHAA